MDTVWPKLAQPEFDLVTAKASRVLAGKFAPERPNQLRRATPRDSQMAKRSVTRTAMATAIETQTAKVLVLVSELFSFLSMSMFYGDCAISASVRQRIS